jgi:hypothetical protein
MTDGVVRCRQCEGEKVYDKKAGDVSMNV